MDFMGKALIIRCLAIRNMTVSRMHLFFSKI
jgi:hypothetical protein